MPPQLRRNTSIEVYGRIDTSTYSFRVFYLFAEKSVAGVFAPDIFAPTGVKSKSG